MMKNDNEKKVKAAQKRADSFYREFKKLKAKFPEVVVTSNADGEIIGIICIDNLQQIRTSLNY